MARGQRFHSSPAWDALPTAGIIRPSMHGRCQDLEHGKSGFLAHVSDSQIMLLGVGICLQGFSHPLQGLGFRFWVNACRVALVSLMILGL